MKKYKTEWQDDEVNKGKWNKGIIVYAHDKTEAVQLATDMYIEEGKENEQAVKVTYIKGAIKNGKTIPQKKSKHKT